jgi:RNA polymerase sigma-70 factor (ECF subfamily)
MSLDPTAFRARHARTIARLYTSSEAVRWRVTADAFEAALHGSVTHRFPEAHTAQEVERYLESLHVGELALACACRAGDDPAWEHFVREYRPGLYAAARAVAGDDGRDLADGLYAELFGLVERDGERKSLLTYYHGRSRLTTWLRSVIVQRHIDRRRVAARLEPLDEAKIDGLTAAASSAPDPARVAYVSMAQGALDEAIGRLEPKDKLRLRLYYGQQLRLAQIGRITGEHEATVSRKLDRVRRDLRTTVETLLRREHGLSEAAVRECLEAAADAPELHLTRLFAQNE